MNKYISLLFIKFKENRKITSAPCQQWFCYISNTRVPLWACSLNTWFSRAPFFFFSFSSSHQTHLRAVLQRIQDPGLAGISEQKGHQCSGGCHIPNPRRDGLLPPLHRPTHLRWGQGHSLHLSACSPPCHQAGQLLLLPIRGHPGGHRLAVGWAPGAGCLRRWSQLMVPRLSLRGHCRLSRLHDLLHW